MLISPVAAHFITGVSLVSGRDSVWSVAVTQFFQSFFLGFLLLLLLNVLRCQRAYIIIRDNL